MKIAISGATGAVGHALIAEFIKQNMDVIVLCRKTSNRINSLCNEIEKMTGIDCKQLQQLISIWFIELSEYHDMSLKFSDDMKKQYGNCDIFFHLAWNGTTGEERNNCELQSKNIEYALDAVKLAKKMGCHTFVGAGSQAEYGRVDGRLSSDTPTHPESEYGMAKLKASQETRTLCKQLEIKHIWTRILSVYGPYDTPNSMVMSSIQKLLNREIPKYTKGEQQWDFLYSEDAGKALLAAGIYGKDGEIYPVGSGKTKSLSEYIEMIRNEIDPKAQIELGAIPYAEKQVMYLCADITKLKEDTGFAPTIEFDEGIRRILKCQFQ